VFISPTRRRPGTRSRNADNSTYNYVSKNNRCWIAAVHFDVDRKPPYLRTRSFVSILRTSRLFVCPFASFFRTNTLRRTGTYHFEIRNRPTFRVTIVYHTTIGGWLVYVWGGVDDGRYFVFESLSSFDQGTMGARRTWRIHLGKSRPGSVRSVYVRKSFFRSWPSYKSSYFVKH